MLWMSKVLTSCLFVIILIVFQKFNKTMHLSLESFLKLNNLIFSLVSLVLKLVNLCFKLRLFHVYRILFNIFSLVYCFLQLLIHFLQLEYLLVYFVRFLELILRFMFQVVFVMFQMLKWLNFQQIKNFFNLFLVLIIFNLREIFLILINYIFVAMTIQISLFFGFASIQRSVWFYKLGSVRFNWILLMQKLKIFLSWKEVILFLLIL